MASGLVTLLLGSGTASAHSVGPQSLTAGLNSDGTQKVDVFNVTCGNEEGGDTPTFRLVAHVLDQSPVKPPKLRVTLTKAGASAFADDPVDGDVNYSPDAIVNGGNGLYKMTVQRVSGKVAENYTVEMHCQAAAGTGFLHTSTTFVRKQNQ